MAVGLWLKAVSFVQKLEVLFQMSWSARIHLTPCRVSMQSSELNYKVQLACILWEMPLCKQRPNSGPKVFSLLPSGEYMCVSYHFSMSRWLESLLFKQTARLFLVHICVSYRTATFPRYHQITILVSNFTQQLTIKYCHPSLPIHQLVQFPQNNHLCIVMALLCRSIWVFYYTSLNCSK